MPATMTSDLNEPSPQGGADAAALEPTMRAVLQKRYGTVDDLSFGRAPTPTAGEGEVLVRVHAAAVHRGDVHMLTGKPYLIRLMGYGLRRPKKPVPGHAIAGRVVALGAGVSGFQVGDRVHAETDRGAFAEYVSVPVNALAALPDSLDFERAAAVPVSATTALQGIRDIGGVQPGQHVLVNGASGGVGSYAVQIAKALGAEVTGVCSTRNLARARELGADHVIDYTQADFAQGDARYDVIFDVVGNRSMKDCLRVLAPGGIYVAVGSSKMGNWIGPIAWMLRVKLGGLLRRKRAATFINEPRGEDLRFLTNLVTSGKLEIPVEQRYPFEETIDALGRMVAGHARGKLVIRMVEA